MGITFSSSSSIVAAKSQYINRIMAIVIPTIVQGLVFFFFMLANIIKCFVKHERKSMYFVCLFENILTHVSRFLP